MLAELLLRDDRHSPNAAAALASICASSAAEVFAAGLGEGRERVHDEGRLVAAPAHGLRSEVRAVGLGQQPVARDAAGGLAQLGGLRIGDVPGERHVPAALERRLEECRRGEAVQDHRPVEAGERLDGVVVGGTGVDHDRLAELGRELELRVEQPSLGVSGRVVAEVVETGLADGDGPRMAQELTQLGDPSRLRSAGLVRVHAERGVDAVVPIGELERLVGAGNGRRDGDDTADARGGGPAEHLLRLLRREVRVRVDHPSPSSSSPVDGSSLRKSGRGSQSGWPGGSMLGSQAPTHVE